MSDRDHFAAAALTGLLALFACGCHRNPPEPQPFKEVVTVCSGCGTEWWSQSGKQHDPITTCPNCPMSEEEFEALKESLRKQLKAGK